MQCSHIFALNLTASPPLQICPKKGKFFVATYSGPWKLFSRHNEILFVKKPKGGKGKERKEEEFSQLTLNDNLMGWEALDVGELFPEEFDLLDLPEMDQASIEDKTDVADMEEKSLEDKPKLASVTSAAATSNGVQTS